MVFDRQKVNEYYIDKDGFKLHAKLHFPENAPERMPLLIVVHGLTGCMEEDQLMGAAQAAMDLGMAALRVELYGHGLSDGDFKNHNVAEWVSELLYIIDYARALPFVTDVYLAGHSQGGLTALLAGGMKADQVKALLLLSPAINIKTDCEKGIFFDYTFDANTIPEELTFWENHTITGNYVRVARMLPVKECVEAYTGPVLIVHGTLDPAVPIEGSISLTAEYQNASLAAIQNDGHCYEEHLDQAVEAIYNFLKAQLA